MKRVLIVFILSILIETNVAEAATAGPNPYNIASIVQNIALGGSCAAELYNAEPFEYVTTTLPEGFYSFDIITSAQNIASGESFVANPRGLTAFRNNPATLIGAEGLNFYYSRRPMDWQSSLEGAHYYSLGLLLDGSFAKFGIDYSRFNHSMSEGRTIYLPEGSGKLIEFYNHTITLSSAIDLYRGIVTGVNLKYFNIGEEYEGGEPDPKQERKGAFVGDIGILYGVKGFANEESIKDYLRFGLSLQNCGTDYRTKNADEEEFHSIKLPRYFRIGFSYELTNYLRPEREFFRLLITGEYKKLLNPGKYDEDETDYGGIGFDYTLFELLSLRIGGIIQPDSDIYGFRDVLAMRYGFGINLPFGEWVLKQPLDLSFDYANIPLYEPGASIRMDKESFSVFTIALKYRDPLF